MDPVHWYVHQFDVEGDGDYRIVRGVAPASKPTPDPFEAVEDPGRATPHFRATLLRSARQNVRGSSKHE